MKKENWWEKYIEVPGVVITGIVAALVVSIIFMLIAGVEIIITLPL